jgi:hypothetical protein
MFDMRKLLFWKRRRSLFRSGPPSLSKRFVGRKRELDTFESQLDAGRRIINVFGEFGLGKSELLRRFEQAALKRGAITGATGETDEVVLGVLRRLARKFGQQAMPLRGFDDSYSTYSRRLSQLAAGPEAPKELLDLAGSGVAATVRLARHLPGLGLAAELLPAETVGKAAVETLRYLRAKIEHEDELELVLDPVLCSHRPLSGRHRQHGGWASCALY